MSRSEVQIFHRPPLRIIMDRFIAVIVGLPLAFLLLYYRRSVKEFIGNVGFAEKYLGVGGTNTLIVIIGILLFVGSLMYAMGTLQSFFKGSIGTLFNN